jgi:hypothetical protein
MNGWPKGVVMPFRAPGLLGVVRLIAGWTSYA